jgi:branched-chain amino acid transport system substrate-binding protein
VIWQGTRALLRQAILALLISLVFNATSLFGQDAKIKVGFALPLSGDGARYGLDIQRGALMAQEDLVRRGIAVAFVSEDTQLIPRVAATAAHKLINRDRVDVIVSLWDTAEAVAPIAEMNKIPHISIRWNPRVAEEFRHTFTFESTYISWVRANLEYLRSQGVKRISILSDSSSAGWIEAREYLLKVVSEFGIVIVKDIEFLGAAGDINLSIIKLLSEPSDYLFMLHDGAPIFETMKRLMERKVSIPIIGYFDGMEPPINLEGRRFIAQFDTQAWFAERYSSRFPGQRPVRAAFGFDLVSILGELVEQLKRKPSSDEILGHLNALRDYVGATGKISANASRNIETTCVLKEIRNGVGVRVAG